jgi:hypothetical protein
MRLRVFCRVFSPTWRRDNGISDRTQQGRRHHFELDLDYIRADRDHFERHPDALAVTAETAALIKIERNSLRRSTET